MNLIFQKMSIILVLFKGEDVTLSYTRGTDFLLSISYCQYYVLGLSFSIENWYILS